MTKTKISPAGKAAIAFMLETLAPDEPLGPPEGSVMVRQRGIGWIVHPRSRWTKKIIDRHAKYPGFQPGHRYREDMKYGRTPHGGSVADWKTAFINHSKAIWSRDLLGGRHRQQFADWFCTYIRDVKPWCSVPEMLQAVAELRSACARLQEVG